ncbi:hypothetical protein [Paraburkholderia sp. ZP32-5]|uniref:hypothetical protein n=1 Tax=Paraburkholderia sp. ZP32-5 TaxID=2883245 RepID=UPI001F22E7D3|nr:hypothetical protein [Paraburkholderia sp. ZP32-5]
MANPNIPSDHFLPGLRVDPCRAELHQIIAPDGRVVVNFLPHNEVWHILQYLKHQHPAALFTFQTVPADQLGIA